MQRANRLRDLTGEANRTTELAEHWLRFLTRTKNSYDSTQRERLKIVWLVMMSQTYFGGTRFTIETDLHSVKQFFNLADAAGPLER